MFLILFSIFSCGIEYDGETKLVVKGKIIDSNNNPIANNPVKLFVFSSGDALFFPSTQNYIGQAITNNLGEYSIVFPSPKNNTDEISIVTNEETNNLNPKKFSNIKITDFDNYQLNLPTSKLFLKSDLTELNVNFIDQTQLYKLIDVSFEGEYSKLIELYNTNNDFLNSHVISVKKNQTILIHYKLKDKITNQISQNFTPIFISLNSISPITETIYY